MTYFKEGPGHCRCSFHWIVVSWFSLVFRHPNIAEVGLDWYDGVDNFRCDATEWTPSQAALHPCSSLDSSALLLTIKAVAVIRLGMRLSV